MIGSSCSKKIKRKARNTKTITASTLFLLNPCLKTEKKEFYYLYVDSGFQEIQSTCIPNDVNFNRWIRIIL